jgi:hypothetical protein
MPPRPIPLCTLRSPAGDLTTADAGEISKLIETYVKAFETAELVERVERLERMRER